MCLFFSNESSFMTQDENIVFLRNETDSLRFEISLISCQIRYIVKIETSIHFLLLCQGLIPFRENMNISHSSVSFHILNCLSVIRGERETIWPSPLLFLHLSFCLLVLDYRLCLSHWDWQLKIIAFIMCVVFIPSSSLFLFMREQKNVELSQSIHFLYWEINERNSAVSSLLWQASKSPCRRTCVCGVHTGRQSFAVTLGQFIRKASTWSKLYATIILTSVAYFV